MRLPRPAPLPWANCPAERRLGALGAVAGPGDPPWLKQMLGRGRAWRLFSPAPASEGPETPVNPWRRVGCRGRWRVARGRCRGVSAVWQVLRGRGGSCVWKPLRTVDRRPPDLPQDTSKGLAQLPVTQHGPAGLAQPQRPHTSAGHHFPRTRIWELDQSLAPFLVIDLNTQQTSLPHTGRCSTGRKRAAWSDASIV